MLSKASSSLSFLTSQSASAPTPEEDKLKTFALAVSYRTNNNSLDGLQVPDKETIVSSCFCHSIYIRYGSKYYIRNPAVNPGDSFSKYDEFLVKLEEWLSKTRIISPVPPGAPTYNSKGLLSLHSRGEVFSIYQRLFQNFFNSCEKENSLSPLDVKTILQSVFSIDNIRQVDPDLADYLGTRQSEIYHLKEPTDAEPLEQFLNMLYLKQGVTDRAWKLRAEPLCEFEFNRKSYRELLLMMKHKMGLQPNDEFSGYFPQSIINLTNPANSKNLATMPTEMDLSDLISVRSWLRQYVRSIRRDEQNVDNFMLDINDVRQKWNILFRRTPLEVEFGNPGLTRIVFCTNLFMRLLEGMLLFFLNTVNSKPYTKDPILTSGKKISDLTIFQLLDYFKNIRMWTVTHGCQGVETSNARVRLTIVRDILTKQSQALLSQMTQQTQDTQLSQEELGFFDSVISGASRLLDKCTDALTCVFGTNCSSSGSTVLYTGTDDDPGGSDAVSASEAERRLEDEDEELTPEEYGALREELLRRLDSEELELTQRQELSSSGHSHSFAATSSSHSSSSSSSFLEQVKTPSVSAEVSMEDLSGKSKAVEEPSSKSAAPVVRKDSGWVAKVSSRQPFEPQSSFTLPLPSATVGSNSNSNSNSMMFVETRKPKAIRSPIDIKREQFIQDFDKIQTPEIKQMLKDEKTKLSDKKKRIKDERENINKPGLSAASPSNTYQRVDDDITPKIQALNYTLLKRKTSVSGFSDDRGRGLEENENENENENDQGLVQVPSGNIKKPKKTADWEGGRSKTRKHKRRQRQTKKNPKKKRTVNKRRQNKKRRTNKH
jgi:hypothetical protein